jgi:probable HAF family extracellular repeat protein
MMNCCFRLLSALIFSTVLLSHASAQINFIFPNRLDLGFRSNVTAINADGSVIAGDGAFIASADGTNVRGIGSTDETLNASAALIAQLQYASDINASGTIVVGNFGSSVFLSSGPLISKFGDVPNGTYYSDFRGVVTAPQAYVWNSGSLLQLNDLTNGESFSYAAAVSANGNRVVGQSGNSAGNSEAFRWASSTGISGLGDLPGGFFYSNAHDVNADGSVIVGTSGSSTGNEAFRWTFTGGMQGLGFLPGGNHSGATATSGDGNVIVGASTASDGLSHAFRWTPTEGMQFLDNLINAPATVATGISDAGDIVVGYKLIGSRPTNFVWTKEKGMFSLQDYATSILDYDLQGNSLNGIVTISGDGTTIIGNAFKIDGPPPTASAFFLHDNNRFQKKSPNNIPEPTTLALFTLGGLAGLLRKKKLTT